MKAYEVALFLLMFNASINIVNNMGIWGDETIYYGQGIQTSMESVDPTGTEEISYLGLAISGFGLLVQSLIAVVLILGYSTVLLPAMLWQLGIPAAFNGVFTLGVWITYIIGYSQYKARTSFLGAE